MADKKKVTLPVVAYDDAVVNPENQSHGEKTIVCSGCALEPKPRIAGVGAFGEVDIMLVSESPSSWSVHNKEVFYGRGGRVIRQTWRRLIDLDERTGATYRFKSLRKFDTYAVQCQVGEGREESASIPKSVVERCSCYLHAAVKTKRPKVILAFGATALKALGHRHAEKFMETRGRVIPMTIAGHECKVIPTFSTRHLVAKTGLYNLFYNDFVRAMKMASGADTMQPIPFEELIQTYTFPKTVTEVARVCDEIINYVVEGAKRAEQCTIAVDTETNTVNPHRADAKVLCISFAWDRGKATAIPLWHKNAWWTESEFIDVLGHVRRVLECPKPKVFHNAKFDLKFLELRHGLRVHNFGWDTMLGEHLLREDQGGSYSLKILGRSYFPAFAGYADKVHELAQQLTEEEADVKSTIKSARGGRVKKGAPGFDDGFVIEMGKAALEKYLYGAKKDHRKKTFDLGYERVPIDILLQYAAVDTDLTRRLVRHQHTRMKDEDFMQARTLMHSHCLPASRVLGKMEFKGMRVDKPYLDYLETELTKVVAAKREDLWRHWDGMARGEEFNPNSPQHVGYLLYQRGVLDHRGVRCLPRLIPGVTDVKTKSGHWKTDKKTLRGVAEMFGCQFTQTLLEYRAAHKALSGFIGDIRMLSEYDGYLHTNFHLHGTSTGRLSSNNLNMQNLPEYLAGFNIKKVFIPDDPATEAVVNVDWKGAEVRVFTAYSGDVRLIDALNQGLDVHSFFTQEIYGNPYEEVANHETLKDTDKERYLYLKKLRTNVKRCVFGILYGAKARKIAETAVITEEEAQRIIDLLFLKFPSIKDYIVRTHAEIHQQGRVETFFHRRRRFPLVAVNGFFRGQAERRGVNMKIQSTSSDIVLDRLCEIDQHIGELGGRTCLTVHDSIVTTVKRKYASQLPDFLDYYCRKRVKERFPWLPVDFTFDVGIGPSYGETIAVDQYLKQEAQRPKSAEELLFQELDQEALIELAEDEDEQKEKDSTSGEVNVA
jgi:uracil-DNA glycosylase family 4